MGDITKTAIRETAVDFSYPYFLTRVGFFTKKPHPLPKFKAILWPFHVYLWLCIAVTLPIFCLMYWLFANFWSSHDKFHNMSLGEAVEHVMRIFLNQGEQCKVNSCEMANMCFLYSKA